jgi:hypothetical protein
VRAYLIDPSLHRVSDIELDDRDVLEDMHRIIGAVTLDKIKISDVGDRMWCDDSVLARGAPCFAFRLRGEGPFGGKCIILGHDRQGEAQAPVIPMSMIENDIDFLDEIVPEIVWLEEPTVILGKESTRFHTVVTYSRSPKKNM